MSNKGLLKMSSTLFNGIKNISIVVAFSVPARKRPFLWRAFAFKSVLQLWPKANKVFMENNFFRAMHRGSKVHL